MSPFLSDKYGSKNLVNDNPIEWHMRRTALISAVEDTVILTDELAEQHNKALRSFVREYNGSGQALLALPSEERPAKFPKYLQEIEEEGVHQYFMEFALEEVQIKKSIAILKALDDFASASFNYFLDGYYVHKQNTLTVSPNYPPRYILKTLLDQLAYDLSIVQRAVDQRRRRADGHTTTQGHALLLADQLATLALQPAKTGGYLDENVSILTHLDQNVRVRLIPYAHTLIVSLAFASVSEKDKPSRDYLALAHEVGHHLYWNGRVPNTTDSLKAALEDEIAADKNIPPWCKHWVEEIFADAYALIVGGPVIALDFQDMLDDDVPGHFRKDTDKHPIPEIRPLIQTEILRQIKDKKNKPTSLYKGAPDLLDTLWAEWLDNVVATQTYTPRNAGNSLTGQKIIAGLKPLINIILDLLSDARPANETIPWSKDFTQRKEIKLLYDLQIPSSEVENKQRMLRYFRNDGSNLNRLAKFLNDLNLDEIVQPITFQDHLDSIEAERGGQLSSKRWIQHFLTHGWSIEGPMGSSIGRD